MIRVDIRRSKSTGALDTKESSATTDVSSSLRLDNSNHINKISETSQSMNKQSHHNSTKSSRQGAMSPRRPAALAPINETLSAVNSTVVTPSNRNIVNGLGMSSNELAAKAVDILSASVTPTHKLNPIKESKGSDGHVTSPRRGRALNTSNTKGSPSRSMPTSPAFRNSKKFEVADAFDTANSSHNTATQSAHDVLSSTTGSMPFLSDNIIGVDATLNLPVDGILGSTNHLLSHFHVTHEYDIVSRKSFMKMSLNGPTQSGAILAGSHYIVPKRTRKSNG